MPLSEYVLILSALVALAVILAGLCRRLPIPHSVLLVVIGITLGQLQDSWQPLNAVGQLQLTPDLVFFILLPALVFESAFSLNARQLLRDLVPILTLAIPALVISTLLIGVGLWWLIGLDLWVALLFGALISATDPVAVIALFKELGAPLRLTVLVEGESLFNDATAIVLFTIVLGLATGPELALGTALSAAALEFLKVFLGGAALGVLFGFTASELLHRLSKDHSAVIAMSAATAYASFIVAEHLLHVSGVMAVTTAALSLALLGVLRMSRDTLFSIHETWATIALICNSLLFLLLGLSIDPERLAVHAPGILLAIPLVLAARAAAVFGLLPVAVRLFTVPRVTRRDRLVLWWGGLKGGLAIAIALAVPHELPGRQLLLDLTLGVVLFTLLINAATLRPLMRRLGLDRLNQSEQAELDETLADARRQAETQLVQLRDQGLLEEPIFDRIDAELRKRLGPPPGTAPTGQRRQGAYLVALKSEIEELDRLYQIGLVNQYVFLDIRALLSHDRETHDGSVREVGQRGANPFLRLERMVIGQLREHDRAAPVLAWYQHLRLGHYLQHNIAGVLMSEAALAELAQHDELDPAEVRTLRRLYTRRLARRRERIAAIGKEFPRLFSRFSQRLFTRAALKSALDCVEQAHLHSEIGAKAFNLLQTRLAAALAKAPPLWESLSERRPVDLLRAIPLFAGLSRDELSALADHAQPLTFLAGDRIIAQGQHGDALYVITRGSVTVYRDGRILAHLAENDFFGEMGLLGDQVRTATVEARVPAVLLRLTRRDVLTVARRYARLDQRLREAREARSRQ